MNTRQKRARLREIRDEMLANLRKRYATVDLVRTESRRSGTTVFYVHVPGADFLDVIQVNTQVLVDLIWEESIDVMMLPISQPSWTRAA